jgi:toluene monooxygenase system protein B
MGTPMPVIAQFRGDFLYALVLIEDTDTIAEVAEKSAVHSVGRRVPRRDQALRVEYQGRVLDPGRTAAEEGVAPMEELIVCYAGG